MNRAFIFTASSPRAREHLAKSITADVPLDDLGDLPEAVIAGIQQRDQIRCWGAMPGDSNRRKWESMQIGDVGLGYTDHRFRFAGQVYAKADSTSTAQRIWGIEQDETWGLMYFFDPLEEVAVEISSVRDALDYKVDWTPRGFSYPSDHTQNMLREKFGSVDAFVASLGSMPVAGPVEIRSDSGVPYRRARTDIEKPEPDRSAYDPDSSGRGVNAHNETQNRLADHLRALGIQPKSPGKVGIKWDIAWERNGALFVGEVKSLTSANEEDQLRKGLGQAALQPTRRAALVRGSADPRCRARSDFDLRLAPTVPKRRRNAYLARPIYGRHHLMPSCAGCYVVTTCRDRRALWHRNEPKA
jgi:hypothetical protein